MNNKILLPENEQQIAEMVAQHSCVLPVGNQTKPPLCRDADATVVSLSGISGMIQYEPSEFTFTAHAGTRVSDLADELVSRRQYLPFDPMLARAGATLGGTVASGMAGPGRFRFGGVRDFLLGARLLCGDGAWTNVGGKVVKNAAGFDVPKLLVGSLGRFGLISEMTVKVFPMPVSLLTVEVSCDSDKQALDRIGQAASSRWELDAIEYRPSRSSLYLRLGGPEQVNDLISAEIISSWPADAKRLDADAATAVWESINELSFAESESGQNESESHAVIKVPTTPQDFLELRRSLSAHDGIEMHLSVAGAATWVRYNFDDAHTIVSRALNDRQLVGLCVRGPSYAPWIGNHQVTPMHRRVKDAMDPEHKFPQFDRVPIGSG